MELLIWRVFFQKKTEDSIWRLSFQDPMANIPMGEVGQCSWFFGGLSFFFFLISCPLLLGWALFKHVFYLEEPAKWACAKPPLWIQLPWCCWVPGTKHRVHHLCCVINFLCCWGLLLLHGWMLLSFKAEQSGIKNVKWEMNYEGQIFQFLRKQPVLASPGWWSVSKKKKEKYIIQVPG